jgi:hypothetical protein
MRNEMVHSNAVFTYHDRPKMRWLTQADAISNTLKWTFQNENNSILDLIAWFIQMNFNDREDVHSDSMPG